MGSVTCCDKSTAASETKSEPDKCPSLHSILSNRRTESVKATPAAPPATPPAPPSAAPAPVAVSTSPSATDAAPPEKPKPISIRFQKGSFIQVIQGDVSRHYKLLNILGSGTFGNVYKAINKISGAYRAIKSIKKKNFDDEERVKLMTEFELLRSLDHPNIINVLEVIEDRSTLNIVTELCTGGELFDRIVESRYFSENKAATYMHQIISAVVCCHKEGVVHRDLKPENIVFLNETAESPLKLIDFGTSKKMQPNVALSNLTGTAYYIAPEVLQGHYNEKCDVWSCGVIMFIMLCGYPPFVGPDDKSIFTAISKGSFSFNGHEWSRVSGEAKSLIMRMLTKNPELRPSAEEVFNDPWVQKRAQNLVKDNILDKQTLSNLGGFRASRILQQAIMEFIVSQMTTAQETEELRKVFISMDLNGDGKLSMEELNNAYSTAGLGAMNMEEILESCDADKNGYIEYTEFLTATMNWKKVLNQEKLISAFKAFDIDGSGSISKLELQAFFGGGSNVDDKTWNELLEQADTNGDGEIDIEEFKNLMLQKF